MNANATAHNAEAEMLMNQSSCLRRRASCVAPSQSPSNTRKIVIGTSTLFPRKYCSRSKNLAAQPTSTQAWPEIVWHKNAIHKYET